MFQELLKALPQDMLDKLSDQVFDERKARVVAKVKNGDYPKAVLFQHEAGGFDKVWSIRQYRDKHGCTLAEAKVVVDMALGLE